MLKLTSTPPALHLGWDMQFTRIARYAGPRIIELLAQLAQPCVAEGFSVYIGHQLQENAVSSTLQVIADDGSVVCVLRCQLLDGWANARLPGAMLDVTLHRVQEDRKVPLPLRRLSTKLSADPGEVYFNAGDFVDVAYLQGPLLACL